MEILGLDPKITICKIAVLPIKLYPLMFKLTYVFKWTQAGIEPAHLTVKMLRLNHLTIGSFFLEIRKLLLLNPTSRYKNLNILKLTKIIQQKPKHT
jgi:hypothetical protein